MTGFQYSAQTPILLPVSTSIRQCPYFPPAPNLSLWLAIFKLLLFSLYALWFTVLLLVGYHSYNLPPFSTQSLFTVTIFLSSIFYSLPWPMSPPLLFLSSAILHLLLPTMFLYILHVSKISVHPSPSCSFHSTYYFPDLSMYQKLCDFIFSSDQVVSHCVYDL